MKAITRRVHELASVVTVATMVFSAGGAFPIVAFAEQHNNNHEEHQFHDSHEQNHDQSGGDEDNQDNEDDNDGDGGHVKGSITVCKILVDSNGSVIDGSSLPSTTFTIVGGTTNTGTLPDTVVNTPLDLNTSFVSNDNDAQCTTYSDLKLGSYHYGQEQIASAASFETPMYNDQFSQPVNSTSDFFTYQEANNQNVDGVITLTKTRKDRTLVVLNQLVAPPPPTDVCPNVDGDQASVPEGLQLNNDGQCVPIVPPPPQCSDTQDNDQDGKIDAQDPGCWTDPNNSETYDANDNSETDPVDVCSNIDGIQTEVPSGKHLEGEGNCVDDQSASSPDVTPSTSGGSNGPIVGSLGGSNGPVQTQGQILGASCGLYMDKHIRSGSSRNDREQVKKLQTFLNKWMGTNLPVTGFYGAATLSALSAFQA